LPLLTYGNKTADKLRTLATVLGYGETGNFRFLLMASDSSEHGCFRMEYIDLLEIIAKVGTLVRSEDAKREADQGPQVHGVVGPVEVMLEVVDLSMTVVAGGDAVVRPGCGDLVELDLAVGMALLIIACLQKAATTAAAKVVRFVRGHINEVLFTNHRLDDKTEVVGCGIPVTFTDDLTRVLHCELNLPFFVPVRTHLQAPLTNPLCVIGVDGSYVELMLNIEFFQSGPD
jgi:hypothetical protein